MTEEATKYCPDCFAWIPKAAEVCAVCGYLQPTQQNPLYLLPQISLRKQYLIGRVLGHGGFAVTYLGYDRNLDVKVAIKEYFPREFATRSGEAGAVILPNDHPEAKGFYEYGLQKFVEEARLLSQLRHAHIIKVLNLFEISGTAYYVMEYLEGQTLKDHIKQHGALPFEKAYALIEQLLDAVDFLHSRNCFHRDIKPANIYLSAEGSPILLDFGSARNQLASQSRSLNATITPGYAPIEQYSVKGRQGPWTDIYALAATCYYLITGNIPPEAADISQGLETIQLPSKLGVALSPAQEKWLMRGLALRPEERPQSITEWRALARFETAVPQQNAKQPQTPQPKQTQFASGSHNRRWLWIGLAVVILIAVGFSLKNLWG